MGVLREKSSPRLRASLRGAIPAVLTLLVFLGGRALLQTIFPLSGETPSLGETILMRFLLGVLYVVMIGLAIKIATHLDQRHYSEFGVNVDRVWLRNFAAGTVISVAGILLSIGWGVIRGFRELDPSLRIRGPDGPLFVGAALATFVLYFFLGNLYEEVVYRGVMIQNFAEGLSARGFSRRLATILATVPSLVLFGLYHLPLRGTFIVTIDAAMTGTTFALAYLLTGELGLPLGIHFGRIAIELLTGIEILGVTAPAILTITQNTLGANLEVRLLEIGLVCLFILAWVYFTQGRVQIANAVLQRDANGPEPG